MGKIELPMENIVKKYEEGICVEEIAKEYSVSIRTIYNRLEEYCKELKNVKSIKKTSQNFKVQIPLEDIVKKYEAGINLEKIAKEYEVSYFVISNRLKAYYEEKGREIPKILKSLNIVKKYLRKGIKMEEIIEAAAKNNVIIPQELINKCLKNNDSQGRDER